MMHAGQMNAHPVNIWNDLFRAAIAHPIFEINQWNSCQSIEGRARNGNLRPIGSRANSQSKDIHPGTEKPATGIIFSKALFLGARREPDAVRGARRLSRSSCEKFPIESLVR
jgi:hypothetical protein